MSTKSWSGVISLVALILGPLLNIVSPMIRNALSKVLQDLYKKAEATMNPIDDLVVGLLLDLLSIPRPQ